jgi:transcriptional regulator with XRE-family HTH domain
MTEPAHITAHWQHKAQASRAFDTIKRKGWEHGFRTGDLLRAGRALAGLTQDELAMAAGINDRTVRKWEAVNTPWRKGHALARMQEALALHGVMVFLSPSPGVRYAAPVEQVIPLTRQERKARGAAMAAEAEASYLAILKARAGNTDNL